MQHFRRALSQSELDPCVLLGNPGRRKLFHLSQRGYIQWPPPSRNWQQIWRGFRDDHMALVRLLLDADRPNNVADIDKAWDDEIRARAIALNDGRASSVQYQEIKQEMRDRFRAK